MMQHKSLLLALAICATTGTTIPHNVANVSHDAVQACFAKNNGAWLYMEHLFVAQHEQLIAAARETANTRVKQAFTAATIASLGYLIKTGEKKSFKDTSCNDILTGAAILGITDLVYNWYLNTFMPEHASVQIVTDFLHNWEAHRELVPSVFAPLFDELATRYTQEGDAFVKAHAQEIVTFIQEQVKIEFSSRHKRPEHKSADMVTTIKTFTEIFKNTLR